MSLFTIIAILVTLAAVFSWVNHRFIRLPVTIGVMLIALVFSLSLQLLGMAGLGIGDQAEAILAHIEFDKALLEGMLSFLLFAGALHINLADLARQKWVIAILASGGLIASTFLVGVGTYYVVSMAGLGLSFAYCLLFGALISPTDPIAVLGILKQVGAPKALETKIAGESLFNDGVAVVVFLVLLEIAVEGQDLSIVHVGNLFVQEAVGGVLFGLGIGLLAYWMLKSVDNYQVEVLVTLAVVTGGYALASSLHVSGPIAIVVAGLMIGNHGRLLAMSETTQEHLDMFWELIDEILNAVLFVLIGLEVLVLHFSGGHVLASLLVIPLVLAARFISVGIPVTVMKRFREFTPRSIRILTWGGLRGGISVALALSIPTGPSRDVILGITYAVVVFSIIVQGLTIGPLIRKSVSS